MDFRKYLEEAALTISRPSVGDELDISINDIVNIETEVLESNESGITIALDERALEIIEACGCGLEDDLDEAEHDKSSNGPYDRGGADAYYGRRPNPHKYVPNPQGAQGSMMKVELTDPAEIAAYKQGYADEDGRKDYGESAEPVNEDIIQHPTHGAVYGKDGKAKLFMTRGEAEMIADAMAKKHPDSKGISIIQGPFTGYFVKMPENMEEGMSKGAIKIKTKIMDMSDDERKAYFKGMSKAAIERKLRLNGFGDKARNYLRYHDGVTESTSDLGDVNEAEPVPGKYSGHFYDAMILANGDYKIVKVNSKKDSKGQSNPLGVNVGDVIPNGKATQLQYQNDGGMFDELKNVGETFTEAEYQGRSVTLGKPTRGDVKKYKVYVRDPKSGNIKKVNFGDKNMEIKRDNPDRRKNFRARHNCSDKKDRTKAGYWSCRLWSTTPVSKIV